MNDAKALMANYKSARDRLRNPANAVADRDIDLLAIKPPVPLFSPRPKLPPTDPDNMAKTIDIRRITFSSTLQFAAEAFDLNMTQIKLHSRKLKYALPRQIAIYLTNKHGNQSLKSMGNYLGMDHTTMMYARDKIKQLILTDDKIRERVHQIEVDLLAAFNRPPLPALSQPYLGGPTEQQNGNSGTDAITAISEVDC